MFSSINQRPAQDLPIQNAARPADVPPGLTATVAAVKSAFQEQTVLRDGLIQKLTTTYQPSDAALFNRLSSYVLELQERAAGGQDVDNAPARKKRKVEGETETAVNGAQKNSTTGPISLEGKWSSTVFEGVSFSVPQRKKLVLEISSQSGEGVRAVSQATKETEFGIPWAEIEHICCLPVPEKAQASRNFCIFPKNGDGLSNATNPTYEPIVWTAIDVLPRTAGENNKTAAQSMLDAFKAAKIKIQQPTEEEFASEIPEPHRQGQKAYHVKAFRGSKDGYLFFLPKGILWGFKKPLIFFSFATIDSISYTSVLQRTFNLNIAARPDAEPVEYEFSMLDQADFAGIDAYIKKNRLQDASMAEQRRAKRLNINAPRGQKGEGSQNVEEESELMKAQQEAEQQAQLQEEDDDEEDDENFDPGSEGESEGSGTSDEESGDEGGGGGGDDDDDEEEDDDDE